jgi:hypothetical protein
VAVLYTVGGSHYDYASLTIFNKLRETVPEHTVNISLSLKEPWGSLGASTNFTQQLNHLASYRLGSYTEANIRVYKGLSVNMSFEYDRIRNQIYLAQGAVSTDEVLLRIRQLATDYSYYGGFGISYSFGSIFNNIVNPRFGGS